MRIKAAIFATASTILVALSAAALTAESPATVADAKPSDGKILFVKDVKEGDTVWDVCARVAGPKDDLQTLVLRTIKNNHLEGKAETLQIGQELRVRVKAAKGGK